MTQDKKPMVWETRGPSFNEWWTNFKELSTALVSVQGEAWWVMDTDLKYLNVRIDTRDLGFIITGREGIQIEPQRVIDAINKYKEWFPSKNSPVQYVVSTKLLRLKSASDELKTWLHPIAYGSAGYHHQAAIIEWAEASDAVHAKREDSQNG